jgi:hypothetical protein
MPTYVAQLSEDKVIQLIAYIKSLKGQAVPHIDAGTPQEGGGTGGIGGAGSAGGTGGTGGIPEGP